MPTRIGPKTRLTVIVIAIFGIAWLVEVMELQEEIDEGGLEDSVTAELVDSVFEAAMWAALIGIGIGYWQLRLLRQQETLRRLKAEQNALLGRLSTAIAHEVKNPATNLSLLLDDLEASCTQADGDLQQRFARCRHNADRILRVVDLIYGLVRSDFDEEHQGQREEVDLARMIDRLITDHLAADAERIRLGPGIEQAVVIGSGEMIHTVLRNLLHNAVHHGDDGGIQLDARPCRRGLHIEIANPGRLPPNIDLAPDSLAINKSNDGLGLGLLITRQLCIKLGAHLQARQDGTMVVFSLDIPGRLEGGS